MLYTYEDEYITNGVDASEIEAAETKAMNDLDKQGVVDGFYLGNMTQCLVYIDLASRQLEAENMQERIDNYRKEYLRYTQMNNHNNVDEGIFTGKIGRA